MPRAKQPERSKPESYAGQHLKLDLDLLQSWKAAVGKALVRKPELLDQFSISDGGVNLYLAADRDVNRRFIEEATTITGVPVPDGLLNNRSTAAAKPAPTRRTKSGEITKIEAADVDADRVATTLLKSGFEAYRDGGDVLLVDPTGKDDGDVLVELTVTRLVRATRSKGGLKFAEPVGSDFTTREIGRIELVR